MPTPRSSSPSTDLRLWQRRALAKMDGWTDGPFLISAAPGAGKTRPALEFARAQLAGGHVGAIVVACPTAPLTRQWAHAAHALKLNLAPDADSPRPPAGFHGVAVTYSRIARAPARWSRSLPRGPGGAGGAGGAGGTGGAGGAGGAGGTLVIADEAHHLGQDLTWGVTFAKAFAQTSRWLLLSGTPFRSDATPIPGVSYDSDGLAEPDVAYSYAEAVSDGVCRPVSFIAYDGTLSWRSGDDVIESSFEEVLSTREASRRYRTAISTDLPEGLPRILREADARLRAARRDGHRNAGGLVVAADSEHARRIAKLLREATGRVPVVVLHAEARAANKLAAFTASSDPWIVAVNMVSEGVDIPRLRVGVYATAAKTPLIFRQIVGRFVRTIPGRPQEPSWLYVPADPVLRDHASTIEQEVRRSLRRPGEQDPDAFDEPTDRRETEPSPAPEFVPLSADVAPQMTLFGGPAPAPGPRSTPSPAAARWLTPEPEPIQAAQPDQPNGGPNSRPAFERRAQLRDQRHQLVSELRRRDGTSHKEINAWLNRKLDIASVEKATIAQLERSIELLYGRLSRRAA